MREPGFYWVKESNDWSIMEWTGDLWTVCEQELDFINDDEFDAGTLIDENPITRGEHASGNITTITNEMVELRKQKRKEAHERMMEKYKKK